MKDLSPCMGLGLVLLLTSAARAQFGDVRFGPLDVNTPAGNNSALGVQELNGEFFVSCRGNGASTTPPHTVYVFDQSGNLLRQFPQDPGANASSWGYRDGATDGTSLMFGCEFGIFVIDPATGTLVNTVQAANGPQILRSNPILGSGLGHLLNYRGLAFDPHGNGGNGSFWTANFGSDLLEVDLDGNILAAWFNIPNWSIFGLALDDHPARKMLWCNALPNAGDLAEIDPAIGLPTGNIIPRIGGGSAQGGLCMMRGSYPNPAKTLVALDQASPDAITGYRLSMFSTVPFYAEPSLVAAAEALPGLGTLSENSPQPFEDNWTLRWNFQDASGSPNAGIPAAVWSNLFFPGPATTANNIQLVPEMDSYWDLSRPAGFYLSFPPGAIGTPDFSLPPIPLGLFTPGDSMRIEGLYINLNVPAPNIPVMVTNTVEFVHRNSSAIRIKAEGGNSFNSNAAAGFWSVELVGPSVGDIVDIEFDWMSSINPGQATMEFDTDQGTMADIFEGGNSRATGCMGTYRNSSDATCGLIYDALNTVPASPCDPSANTGWIGTNPTSRPDSWKTLKFRFTNFTVGKKFEFDCDTDGGVGIDGSSMDGLRVTITTTAGAIFYQGFLAADPTNSNVATLIL